MTVKIGLENGRVVLRTTADSWRPSLPNDCKSIPGWNFSKRKDGWTYPLSMATLRQMRVVFGDDLKVGPELMAWARAERAKEKRLKGYAAHHDAALTQVPILAPVLAKAMEDRTYQRSAARFAAVSGSYLLADEPGLGKTATSLAGIMESGVWEGSHLVVAPKTALDSTWGRQIRLWTELDESVYVMPEGAVNRAKTWAAFYVDSSPTKFLVVNPTMLSRLYGRYCRKCDVWKEDLDKAKKPAPPKHYTEKGHPWKRTVRKESWPEILGHEWTTVTVDESHAAFAAYTPANVTQATQGLLDLHAERKYALTGTPLRGQEKNIWGTLDWLGLETGGYWAFMESYMEISKGFFGSEIYGLDPARASEFAKVLDRYVLRRTRAEARPDLPLGQRVDVFVEMDKKQREQYETFERDGEAELESGNLFGKGLLSEMTRLKQLAYGRWTQWGDKLMPTLESPKLEWILEFLRARGITGKKTTDWLPEPGTAYKVVIGSQFTEILESMKTELERKGIPTLIISGKVTGNNRTSAIATFQSTDTKYRVMLIQTATGGVAIDLDAWCDEMIIMDETFIADDQVQLEGRINNRSGRVSPRMWWYLRTANTIEQKIAESNYAQHATQHNLLDGRRGVKVALHLLRGK